MNRSSTWTICRYLLSDLADRAIVVEWYRFRQSGEFYVAVFEDFILTVDNRDVWQKLYALKVAGDELWNYVSKENLLNFATVYQQTNAVVMLNALLFEDEDFKSLQSILATFGDFQAGKLQLARFRATDPEHEDAFRMRPSGWEYECVSRQIAKNKEVKAAYDALLNEISTAFRLRVIQIVT